MRDQLIDDIVRFCAKGGVLSTPGKASFGIFMSNLSMKISPFPSIDEWNKIFLDMGQIRIFDENGEGVVSIVDAKIVNYDLKLTLFSESADQTSVCFRPEMREIVIREGLHHYFEPLYRDKVLIDSYLV